MQCTYKRDTEARSHNHCCRIEALIIQSVCVSRLSYSTCKAQAPRCVVTGSPNVCTLFCPLSHKRHDFREKVMGHNVCFDILHNFV